VPGEEAESAGRGCRQRSVSRRPCSRLQTAWRGWSRPFRRRLRDCQPGLGRRQL